MYNTGCFPGKKIVLKLETKMVNGMAWCINGLYITGWCFYPVPEFNGAGGYGYDLAIRFSDDAQVLQTALP